MSVPFGPEIRCENFRPLYGLEGALQVERQLLVTQQIAPRAAEAAPLENAFQLIVVDRSLGRRRARSTLRKFRRDAGRCTCPKGNCTCHK